MKKLFGARPTLMILDDVEIPNKGEIDFSKLEEHIVNYGHGIIQTKYTEHGIVCEVIDPIVLKENVSLTGRTWDYHPELQLLPGSVEKHNEAWSAILGLNAGRGSSKTILNLELAKFALGLQESPAADHPSRKREPKGPRGRWGKL